MRSLQQRLSLGLGLSLILLLAVQWLLVTYYFQQLTEGYVASRLEHDVESILADINFDQRGVPALNPSALGLIYHQPYSGHYFRVESQGTVIRSRSLWDDELHINPNAKEIYQVTGPQRQPLLVLQRTYMKQSHPIHVAVAEDLSGLKKHTSAFLAIHAVISAASLVLLLLAQRTLVHRSLLPLDELRREVARLERGQVSALSERVPTEVQPLVHEINHLLEVTDKRLRRSRDAVGNLAHALKTPLSLIHQYLEAPEGHREAIGRQLLTIRELVDRELKRARLSGGPSPGKWFRPNDDLPHIVAAVKGIYRPKDLRIECLIPVDTQIAADRDDMLELIGNLLDNAGKWAHTRIVVTIGRGPALSLAVEDDGPGAPPETLAELTLRGTRLDESRAGHGLGLSIVKAVVEDYGGSLTFDSSPTLGGMRVRVELPTGTLRRTEPGEKQEAA